MSLDLALPLGTLCGMPKPKKTVKIRQANKADLSKLVELNRAAYPVLAGENVVWGEKHLLNHQRIFPEGQLVAEAAGKIVRHSRRPPGMGVKFTSIDDATRAHIEEVLARHKPIDSGAPLRLPEPRPAEQEGK